MLTDDHELAGDALLELVQRAVAPAHLLVGDQLQRRAGTAGVGASSRNTWASTSADTFMSCAPRA